MCGYDINPDQGLPNDLGWLVNLLELELVLDLRLRSYHLSLIILILIIDKLTRDNDKLFTFL